VGGRVEEAAEGLSGRLHGLGLAEQGGGHAEMGPEVGVGRLRVGVEVDVGAAPLGGGVAGIASSGPAQQHHGRRWLKPPGPSVDLDGDRLAAGGINRADLSAAAKHLGNAERVHGTHGEHGRAPGKLHPVGGRPPRERIGDGDGAGRRVAVDQVGRGQGGPGRLKV
jgi:hypothetical protein